MYEGCLKNVIQTEYTKFDRVIPHMFLSGHIEELDTIIKIIECKVKSQEELDGIYTDLYM